MGKVISKLEELLIETGEDIPGEGDRMTGDVTVVVTHVAVCSSMVTGGTVEGGKVTGHDEAAGSGAEVVVLVNGRRFSSNVT